MFITSDRRRMPSTIDGCPHPRGTTSHRAALVAARRRGPLWAPPGAAGGPGGRPIAGLGFAARFWQDSELRVQRTHPNLEVSIMGKGGRKRRDRRKNPANHGKRPNA
ncbi:hypothetical protein brsh051_27650 [Brooklawnia propionicigenes]|uniref:Uncharacterized protein n=1 Tax=Brooklawnia propionicigenes TaxID=3041175 RepID=A0AAN0KFK4_9ACTN|nr:hypothetical protein brsh051_27650 [Brooklawnia sp. SH051]